MNFVILYKYIVHVSTCSVIYLLFFFANINLVLFSFVGMGVSRVCLCAEQLKEVDEGLDYAI